MTLLSRREMVILGMAGVMSSATSFAQTRQITAGDVVDRIKANLGKPWISTGYRDTFKIGDPQSPVRGICSTFGTNLRVMKLAQEAGLNMIITHEPTFWSDADVVDLVKNDEIYKIKTEFAEQHGMVVWRIHDNWHAHIPDGIRLGFGTAIG